MNSCDATLTRFGDGSRILDLVLGIRVSSSSWAALLFMSPTCVYMISSISIVHISPSCQSLRLLSECKMFWQQQQQEQHQHQHQHQFCMYTQGLQGRTDMFHWRGATLPSPLDGRFSFSPGWCSHRSKVLGRVCRGPILQEINSECHVFSMLKHLLQCYQYCFELIARYCSARVCSFVNCDDVRSCILQV